MQDIANEAGVGKATVSLALRDDPRIRLETRQRIKAVAERLGYKSNPTVANLMAQLRASRTPKFQATLAFINACSNDPELRGVSTFQSWLRGARQRAQNLGYEIDFFWLHEPGVSPARRLKILQSRNIKGIIVAGVLDDNMLGNEHSLLWPGFANVAVGRRLAEPALHYACNDQYATSLQAMAEVKKRGYERPGLVLIQEVDDITDRRFSAGYWAGQQKLFPEKQLPIHYLTSRENFATWFKAQKPDVILTLDQNLPTLLAQQPGGDKIGRVHLDWQPELQKWAGMNQNNEVVGAAAIDILIGQIHRNESGIPTFPRSILIGSTWVDGPSLPIKAP